MTTKEVIQELFLMQTEAYVEAEKYKMHKLDGGRNERKAEALGIALQYLMHSSGHKVEVKL